MNLCSYILRKTIKGELILFDSTSKEGIEIVPGVYLNRARNEAQGAELALNFRFYNWQIDYRGSYTQSENVTKQKDYVAFPHYIHNLGLGYEFPEKNINPSLVYTENGLETEGFNVSLTIQYKY